MGLLNIQYYEVSNILIRTMVWFFQENCRRVIKCGLILIELALDLFRSVYLQFDHNKWSMNQFCLITFVMASTLCIPRARIERVRNAWPFLQFSVHINSVHTQITTARRKIPNTTMTPIVIAVNKRLSPMKYPFSTIFDKESVTEYFFKKMVLV